MGAWWAFSLSQWSMCGGFMLASFPWWCIRMFLRTLMLLRSTYVCLRTLCIKCGEYKSTEGVLQRVRWEDNRLSKLRIHNVGIFNQLRVEGWSSHSKAYLWEESPFQAYMWSSVMWISWSGPRNELPLT